MSQRHFRTSCRQLDSVRLLTMRRYPICKGVYALFLAPVYDVDNGDAIDIEINGSIGLIGKDALIRKLEHRPDAVVCVQC